MSDDAIPRMSKRRQEAHNTRHLLMMLSECTFVWCIQRLATRPEAVAGHVSLDAIWMTALVDKRNQLKERHMADCT
jgi:hypothetical protein